MITKILFWITVLTFVSLMVALITKQYKKTGKPFPWTWVGAVLGVLLLVLLFKGGCSHKAKTPPAPSKVSVTTAPETVEALVLMHEEDTPCSAYIDYKFRIRTEGHPLNIKFQGVKDPVIYPGEGKFDVPPESKAGELFFTSPDPLHPNVRVQIYKVVKIRP